MAVLKKHGECFILEYTWHRKAYCTDGKVLTSNGNDWRISGKLKANVTAEQAYKHNLALRDEVLAKRPCLNELRQRVHTATKSWARRAILKIAVEMLYDDIDGLWAELQDHPNAPHLSVSDCDKIATAYKNALLEVSATRSI